MTHFLSHISGVPALYMMLVVPLGYLVDVTDIPGHSHYLYYDGNQLSAYVGIVDIISITYLWFIVVG